MRAGGTPAGKMGAVSAGAGSRSRAKPHTGQEEPSASAEVEIFHDVLEGPDDEESCIPYYHEGKSPVQFAVSGMSPTGQSRAIPRGWLE